MRKEPFAVGSFVHVMKRGARGMPIVQDAGDRWRFMLMLAHFNDHFLSETWYRDLLGKGIMETLRHASTWPAKNPFFAIESFTLMHNHFHLILKETEENGVSRFMHKLGTGMVNHANAKYKEKGSLFQGPYRSRTIVNDTYFRQAAAYVMVKNVFELFPEGYEKACASFDEAWEWAIHYPFSSLGHYAGVIVSPVLANPLLKELFPKPREFRSFAHDVLSGRGDIPFAELENDLEDL